VNYRWQEDEGDSSASTEQRLRLNWDTALPLAGFNLTGPEYRWMVEYREFEEKIFEDENFTQTTDTFFTTLTLEPDPEFPELTFDFSRTTSEDDLDEPQTDFVETDWGVRATYDKGPFSIRYSHRESDFENNLTFPTITDLQTPTGVAVDLAGIIYVTDSTANRVFRFSSAGAFLGEFGSFGTGEGRFRNPRGIAVDSSFIYIVDSDNDRVQRFDLQGRFVSEFGSFGTGNGEFNNPYDVAVDSTGIYVTDQDNNRVQKFSLGGNFLFAFPGSFSSPTGIASNGSQVFVADTQNHRIQVFTSSSDRLARASDSSNHPRG